MPSVVRGQVPTCDEPASCHSTNGQSSDIPIQHLILYTKILYPIFYFLLCIFISCLSLISLSSIIMISLFCPQWFATPCADKELCCISPILHMCELSASHCMVEKHEQNWHLLELGFEELVSVGLGVAKVSTAKTLLVQASVMAQNFDMWVMALIYFNE